MSRWKNATQCIGDFDGAELKLEDHVMLRRGLSYQAYLAYLNCSESDNDVEMTCMFGSPGKYGFKSMSGAMEKQYRKDVEEETADD